MRDLTCLLFCAAALLLLAACSSGPQYDVIVRGGTIYDLAGPLYGYTARGEDFLRLRGELRRLFGLEAPS